MEDFNDIKALWAQAAPHAADASIVIRAARKYRAKIILRTSAGILALAGALVVVSLVAFHYQFRLVTTRIGIALVILAIVSGMLMNSQLVWLLLKPNSTVDNKTFLKTIKELQQKEQYVQTKFLSLYFAVLSIGMMLYLFEFTYGGLLFSVIIYSATMGWILLAWLYLRPRSIRKQRERTQKIIDQLEGIAAQMEE